MGVVDRAARSERRLRHELGLDAEQLAALRHELIDVKGWVVAEADGQLAWAGADAPVATARPKAQAREAEAEARELPPGGERRQLTVMFCDLVGSTALSTQLDPEDMQNLIALYHDAVTPVIRRHDGFIAKYMGDGILIYFGYPQAQEKDAQRAVLAGLAIIETMSGLTPELPVETETRLAVRIGIATGTVVVGDTIGEGAAEERTVVGETPNLAARLQGLAPTNGLVISSVTKELVADGFDLLDLGEQDLKGIDEPAGAWQVLGEHEDEFEGEVGGDSEAQPLVGRQEELGLLLRAWQQSKDGTGQVVTIRGEAGIGKSRLIEAISAEVRADGFARVTLRCSPHHANSALYPTTTHLRRVMGWNADDTTDVKLEKMESAIAGYQFVSEDTVPLLAALYSLELPEGRYPPLTLTPQQQRLNTLDTVLAWLLEEAERQPVLAVWEDIHWADPSTLDMIAMMIEQCPTVPILNAMTFRPDFVPSWTARSHILPVTLSRLERPEVEALIQLQTGGKSLPPELVEHIVSRSDGVPLYVGELTRGILASGSLKETEQAYELTEPFSDLSIPATLQDSLMARLDKAPAVREVAQLGAVFGREFPYDMLKAVGAIEESALREGLGQLVEAELLYQRGRLPKTKYMFKHALIQDAAYQSLLRRTRQHYHREVASLLSSQFVETVETSPEILAHHYTEAGDNDQAIDYWLRAGQLALQRSANHEAIGHLNKGLSLLPEGTPNAAQELGLQRALGTAYMATKGYGAPETAAAFDRARRLCSEVDDDTIFPVMFGVWVSALTRAMHPTAYEVAVETQDLAQRTQDPYVRFAGQVMVAISHLHMGSLLDAKDHFDTVLDTTDPVDFVDSNAKALLYGLDVAAAGYVYGAWCEWLMGRPDQALRLRQKALDSIDVSQHGYSRSRAYYWCAVVNQLCGDWQQVEKFAELAVGQAKEHGLAMVVAVGQVMQGAAATALYGGESRSDAVADALRSYAATDSRFQTPYLQSMLANMLLKEGAIEAGMDVVNAAWHLIQETSEHYFGAEILRLKGELLAAQKDRVAEAEASLVAALELARNQDAKSLELRAACSLARFWQRQGKAIDARDLLAPVYAWFTEGHGTRDLQDAKTLLDELA